VNGETLELLWRTLACAGLALAVVALPGLALAWTLARHRFAGRGVVETLVTLPLVAPPVATGWILLRILGRCGAIGGFLHERLGFDVVFTTRSRCGSSW
jgi:molybdate transport system permease protein